MTMMFISLLESSRVSESHVVFSHVWQTGELLHLCEIFVSLV